MDAHVNQTDAPAFLRFLAQALARAKAEQQSIGLLVVHVENFDRIVLALGFRTANKVIAELAHRLQRATRPQDSILRIADAKFAVVVNPVRAEGVLVLAANKLSRSLSRPVRLETGDINVTPRIGISLGPEQADSADNLLQRAETALLAAVTENAPYAAYAPSQSAHASDALGLELEFDTALKRNELELYYQPKISAVDFKPCGAEALLRWTSPKRGPISPDIFIPLAEKTGRMDSLTQFVLNTALRQSAEWPRQWGALSVAVNVTPRVIEDGDLGAMVASAVGMWDAAPQRLFIEITEGAIMRDPARSFEVLRGLRDLGAQISIDDFGTGYSSLAYFKNIPADELKIDKSFVINMLENRGDKQIVRTVIELAKSFGLRVTAEGVEDRETAAMLAQLGCDRLQGYFYSKPLPQAQFVAWLDAYRDTAPSTAPSAIGAGS